MNNTIDMPNWLQKWFSSVLECSAFRIERIPLSSSSEWSFCDGAIRHRSGRFFSVVGARWRSPGGQNIEQPIIEQTESGTLGFLLRENGGNQEVLTYAKIEPGNIGVVQMAPTCQATASNILRIHGGKAPPFCEWFVPNGACIIHDSLQSEQGTRFLGKRNRNTLGIVTAPALMKVTHRWLRVEEMLELLKFDYLINTDARSVLVCSPWERIVGRAPFTRYSTPFGLALANSSTQMGRHKSISAVRKEFTLLRDKINPPEIIPLDKMDGWELTDEGLMPASDKPFAIYQIKVISRGREVHEWDQPILDSFGEGRFCLACGRIDGVLHFLFRPQIEPGLYNSVELGPTVCMEPGEKSVEGTLLNRPGAVVVVESRQSDEGGRFYQDSSLYQIIDVGEAYDVPDGWQWLTLKQIRLLLNEGGWFTNEARSVLSLVLAWL